MVLWGAPDPGHKSLSARLKVLASFFLSLFHGHLSCSSGTQKSRGVSHPLSLYLQTQACKNNPLSNLWQGQYMYLIANYLRGQRVVSTYSSVNGIVYWVEKHNQPWSLSMLAIARASLTPSDDFILSRMNELNEYVPSSSAIPFHSCQVCVCVRAHALAQASLF